MELYMDNVSVIDMKGIRVRVNKWGGAVVYLESKDTTTTGTLVLHDAEVRKIIAAANIRRLDTEG